jgi:nicotinamidase-related amidase
MRSAFVVIDCQVSYDFNRYADSQSFKEHLLAALQEAVNNRSYIIVFELDRHDEKLGGHSIPEIIQMLEAYPDKLYLDSNRQDKSRQLIALGLAVSTLTIAGINLDECVYATIKGLVDGKYNHPIIIGPVFSFNYFNDIDYAEMFNDTIDDLVDLGGVSLSEGIQQQYEDNTSYLYEL